MGQFAQIRRLLVEQISWKQGIFVASYYHRGRDRNAHFETFHLKEHLLIKILSVVLGYILHRV